MPNSILWGEFFISINHIPLETNNKTDEQTRLFAPRLIGIVWTPLGECYASVHCGQRIEQCAIWFDTFRIH